MFRVPQTNKKANVPGLTFPPMEPKTNLLLKNILSKGVSWLETMARRKTDRLLPLSEKTHVLVEVK